jgi:HD-like signal output (HDOD) protein
MMAVRSVRARIERLETLPTIPTVVRKLLETFENPRTSLREIGGS